MSFANPLTILLRQSPFLLLDGGLATELEARGCQIADKLWSAKILAENPDIIRDVHLDYFRARARCVITASYQASVEGFRQRGLDPRQAIALFKRSVTLADDARRQYLQEEPDSFAGRWISRSLWGISGRWIRVPR